jgi:hypothetical protein
MADNKRGVKRKGFNPASIFLTLAVVTYFVGLPFPVTVFLGFIAFILFRAQKDGKSLKNLPVPPPANETSADSQDSELSTDFGRQSSQDIQDWLKQHMPSEFEQAPEPRAPQPTPAQPAPTRAAATQAKPSPYRLNTSSPRNLALQLRSKQGLRQAIVAMAVLGPPRALNAYVADPMQGATLDPTPSSIKPNH